MATLPIQASVSVCQCVLSARRANLTFHGALPREIAKAIWQRPKGVA